MSHYEQAARLQSDAGLCFFLSAALVADAVEEGVDTDGVHFVVGTLTGRLAAGGRFDEFAHAWVELPSGVLAPTVSITSVMRRDDYYRTNGVRDAARVPASVVAALVEQHGIGTQALTSALLTAAGYRFRVVSGSVLPAL